MTRISVGCYTWPGLWLPYLARRGIDRKMSRPYNGKKDNYGREGKKNGAYIDSG